MIANRLVWVALGVGLVASAAVAQSNVAPAPASLFPGLTTAPRTGLVVPTSGTTPLPVPGAAGAMTAAPPPAMDTLTVPGAPPGAVCSPWCGDTPAGGCCGPVGGHGTATYEGYLRTGVSLIGSGGEPTQILKTFGWNVTGGARTLLFNPAGDTAWAIDLGVGFTRHEGTNRPSEILVSSLKGGFGDAPDTLAVNTIALERASFNFAIGRDYFLNGPGVVGQQGYGNVRFGWDVGGRWGSASLLLRPEDEPGGYRHRQSVYHGLALGAHLSWERPMGAWTLFAGGRAEWVYNWTNVIPPQDGDFREVNLLMMFGVRF